MLNLDVGDMIRYLEHTEAGPFYRYWLIIGQVKSPTARRPGCIGLTYMEKSPVVEDFFYADDHPTARKCSKDYYRILLEMTLQLERQIAEHGRHAKCDRHLRQRIMDVFMPTGLMPARGIVGDSAWGFSESFCDD